MLTGVLLPLVNEESRNAVELPVHVLGIGGEKVDKVSTAALRCIA